MTTESPKKKKVLILITKSNFGGAQRYVYDIARHLKDTYDVSVACGGEGTLTKKLAEVGIRTISIPFLGRDVNPVKDIFVLFKLYSLIQKERPDILHLNSSKIGGLGALAGKIAKVPRIVFTAHGWAWNEDRGLLSKTLVRAIYALTFAFSDSVIAVSEAIRSQGLSLPFSKKMVVIHHGLDDTNIVEQSIARNTLPEKARSKSIIFGSVAELHPIKGLSYAIRAFAELTDIDASYVIWGEGEKRKELESLIHELGLGEKVFLTGNKENAASFMKAFDCLIVPSLSEALGYVILEAGNAGIPVIATSVGGIPEIITDMKSGILVHPQNVKEIVRAVRFMAQNKDKRDALALSLTQSVRERFAMASMIQATIQTYEG
jgi:glycosyltransferase involved in cell wall biosynthesis